jgi:hypothetical protein
VELLKEGEMTFVRNIRKVAGIPFQNWCIKADDNICTIYNNLYLKDKPYYSFEIRQRSDDFSYFLMKTKLIRGRGGDFPEMRITRIRERA